MISMDIGITWTIDLRQQNSSEQTKYTKCLFEEGPTMIKAIL